MFFDSWQGLARVVLVGVPAYAGLVLMLRLSGNRTLAKMSAFDLVVTVALGSTLATILTSGQVALAEGSLALALLITLQFVIAWACARSRRIESLVKAEPILLCYEGRFLEAEMRRARVSRAEVLAAMREHGIADPGDVSAVVLESAGEFSVIRQTGEGRAPATLDGVAGDKAHGANARKAP